MRSKILHARLLALLFIAGCGDDGVADAGPDGLDAGPDAMGVDSDAGEADAGEEAVQLQQGTTLELADGTVRGESMGGTRTFIGIPYAAPPVGDLRWKPPQPVEPWTNTLEATGPGVACTQLGTLIAEGTVEQVEDCLQLNVFAPDPAPEGPVPVMVWIHGGSNVSGSANALLGAGLPLSYDGAAMRAAASREVVVVTVNYRLGALGFLAHPALTAEQGTSGNYGLMDQQAALRWVQRNIAAFGGDPSNVTLFGESAGAWDTCFQTVAVGHEGLFHRAILQSGTCVLRVKALAEAESEGEALATSLGCDAAEDAEVLDCLRSMPADDVLPVEPAEGPGGVFFLSPEDAVPLSSFAADTGSLAVVDGEFLAEQPATALTAGRFARVPMIIGTNAREASLFLTGGSTFADEAEYMQGLEDVFGSDAARIAVQYPAADDPSANDAAIEAASDFVFVCPARAMARRVSRYADVFVYNWNRGADFPPFAGLGPTHAVELAWVWDWWTTALGAPADEVALAQQVVGYWTSMAASGDPNGDDAPAWPIYDADTDAELVFDLEISVEEGRRNARCDFWDEIVVAAWGDEWLTEP